VKLHSLTLRPDARPPTGIRGRTIDASAVEELAVVDHSVLGRCYLVHAKGQRPRYYLPAAVESCEPRDDAPKTEQRCAVCNELVPPGARGQTCSKGCARKLGFRRTGR
jgi:hypothetical protein